MKLKCKKHDRRVVVLPESIVHRNGDGSKCDPMGTLILGDKQFTGLVVRQFGPHEDPRKRLITDIFTDQTN